MPEFTAKGYVTRNGVRFFIVAASLDEAKEKARNGEWQDYDDKGADTVDWVMDVDSVKEADAGS